MISATGHIQLLLSEIEPPFEGSEDEDRTEESEAFPFLFDFFLGAMTITMSINSQ